MSSQQGKCSKTRDGRNPQRSVNRGTVAAAILMLLLAGCAEQTALERWLEDQTLVSAWQSQERQESLERWLRMRAMISAFLQSERQNLEPSQLSGPTCPPLPRRRR